VKNKMPILIFFFPFSLQKTCFFLIRKMIFATISKKLWHFQCFLVFVTDPPQLAISLHIMWSFYAIEHALTVHFLFRKVIVKCLSLPIHPKPKALGFLPKSSSSFLGKSSTFWKNKNWERNWQRDVLLKH
jgi:hypothetical protein